MKPDKPTTYLKSYTSEQPIISRKANKHVSLCGFVYGLFWPPTNTLNILGLVTHVRAQVAPNGRRVGTILP